MTDGAPAIRFVARAWLRRGWRASVAMGVLAGVVSGVVLWSWAADRRGASALDRFLAHVAAPQVGAGFCEPDVTTEALAQHPELCSSYDPLAELAAIRALPGVVAATRQTTYVVRFELPDGGTVDAAPLGVALDPGFTTPDGDLRVVEGRVPDPAAPDQIAIGPNAARQTGAHVGDRVTVIPYTAEQFAVGDMAEPRGERHQVTLVGILEGPADLLAVSGLTSDPSVPSASAAWGRRHGDGVAAYGTFVVARLADGDIPAFQTAVARRWPGRPVQVIRTEPLALSQLHDAIGYESLGLALMAGVGALLALVFVGQAVWRQAGREAEEARLYVVLGMRPRQLLAAATLSAGVPAACAALVAGVLAVGASSLAPIGQARRAELASGTRVDLTVLLVGGTVVAAMMLLLRVRPVAIVIRNRGRGTPSRTATRWVRWSARLRPPESVGMRLLATPGPGRTASLLLALPGLTAAVALTVAALDVNASFGRMIGDHVRYGASWDLQLGGTGDFTDDDRLDLAAVLRASPGVAAAAGLIQLQVSIDGEALDALAFDPVVGVDAVEPVVTSGRTPGAPGEIAMGTSAMRRLGLHLGSTVLVGQPDLADVEPLPATVVGTAIINDGGQFEAGEGVIGDVGWFREDFGVPQFDAQRYVVRLRDGASGAALADEVSGRWGPVGPPAVQYGIRNFERINWLPAALALMAAGLGVVVLLHALLASSRAHRGTFAVLRALGFTRRQLARIVTSQAVLLGVLGGVLGVGAGTRIGDQVWRAIGGRIGIDSPLVASGWTLAVPAGAVLLSVVLAVVPGALAARRPPARALRAP